MCVCVERLLAVALSARKNLCVHPTVSQGETGKAVDAGCMSLTAPWIRQDPTTQRCPFYENLEDCLGPAPSFRRRPPPPSPTLVRTFRSAGDEGSSREASSNAVLREKFPRGVFSLEDLRSLALEGGSPSPRQGGGGMCPYFLARRLLSQADILVCTYPYLLDPRIAEIVGTTTTTTTPSIPNNGQFPSVKTIVIFDEAHNIDNVCLESMSVEVTRPVLDGAMRCLSQLTLRVRQLAEADRARLEDEYRALLQGLASYESTGQEQGVLLPRLAFLLGKRGPIEVRSSSSFMSCLLLIITSIPIRSFDVCVEFDSGKHPKGGPFRRLSQTTLRVYCGNLEESACDQSESGRIPGRGKAKGPARSAINEVVFGETGFPGGNLADFGH